MNPWKGNLGFNKPDVNTKSSEKFWLYMKLNVVYKSSLFKLFFYVLL